MLLSSEDRLVPDVYVSVYEASGADMADMEADNYGQLLNTAYSIYTP